MAESGDITVAIAALSTAQADYSSQRAGTAELLAHAQLKREEAMRLVAALGVSHRQIGELTNLSHTRVNQILGTGKERIPEAHLPPNFGGGPNTPRDAVVRLLALEGPHGCTREEIRQGLVERGWPRDGVEDVVTALTAEGAVLSADEGRFTIHQFGQAPAA